MKYYYSVNSSPHIETIELMQSYFLHNVEDCENLAEDIVELYLLGYDFEIDLKNDTFYENEVKIALFYSDADIKPFFETRVYVAHNIEIEINIDHSVYSKNSAFRI